MSEKSVPGTTRSPCWNLSYSLILACAVGCSTQIDHFPPAVLYAERMEAEAGEELDRGLLEVSLALEETFGSPDEPRWPDYLSGGSDSASLVSLDNLRRAAGPTSSDQQDTQFGLYRKHCIQCHGIAGSGRGPAGKLLNPYARDFRQGKFKFKSTPIDTKPTRQDLERLLHRGVPGTSMPSFALLKPEDLEALVDYVIYLAMRGETERILIREIAYNLDVSAEDHLYDPSLADSEPEYWREQQEFIARTVTRVARGWREADQRVPDGFMAERAPAQDRPEWMRVIQHAFAPEPQSLLVGDQSDGSEGYSPSSGEDGEDNANTKQPSSVDATKVAGERLAKRLQEHRDDWLDSIENGARLFRGNVASCAQCHGETAMGNGQIQDYDDWTKDWTVLAGLNPDDPEAIAPLLRAGAFKPRPLPPRNLRRGVYRGGGRPEDLYLRIAHGIEGTPMPAAPMQPVNPQGLTRREVWDLVNYLLQLPYEPLSREITGKSHPLLNGLTRDSETDALEDWEGDFPSPLAAASHGSLDDLALDQRAGESSAEASEAPMSSSNVARNGR